MKKIITLFSLIALFQFDAKSQENFGHTLNIGVGAGYYGYYNHSSALLNINYEFNVANSLAKAFYERHRARVVESAFELQRNIDGKKLMTTKHCLKYFLDACSKNGGKADFKEPLYLVYQGKKYRLNFDCQNCQMEIWNTENR